MSGTKYTAKWDIPTIYKGDTLDPFTLTLKVKDTQQIIIPDSVCVKLKDVRSSTTHNLSSVIDPSGKVTILGATAEVTSKWASGVYEYDVEYTINNRVRTYLTGKLRVLEDISKCPVN